MREAAVTRLIDETDWRDCLSWWRPMHDAIDVGRHCSLFSRTSLWHGQKQRQKQQCKHLNVIMSLCHYIIWHLKEAQGARSIPFGGSAVIKKNCSAIITLTFQKTKQKEATMHHLRRRSLHFERSVGRICSSEHETSTLQNEDTSRWYNCKTKYRMNQQCWTNWNRPTWSTCSNPPSRFASGYHLCWSTCSSPPSRFAWVCHLCWSTCSSPPSRLILNIAKISFSTLQK